MQEFTAIAPDVELASGVTVARFVNLYGCKIGAGTKIGTFVEVQKGAVIGRNCKISSHSFVCSGVTIGDGCFIGHGVIFVNDNHPQAVTNKGDLETEADWAGRFVSTTVGSKSSIGSNATILGDISIGEGVLIGAGSVVTKDVPSWEVWAGNPAKLIRKRATRNEVNHESLIFRSEIAVSDDQGGS